jgi:hypothetical protein
MLCQELPGYAAYMAQVKYRLIPRSCFCINFAPDKRLTLNLAVVYTGVNELGPKGFPDHTLSWAQFGRWA